MPPIVMLGTFFVVWVLLCSFGHPRWSGTDDDGDGWSSGSGDHGGSCDAGDAGDSCD